MLTFSCGPNWLLLCYNLVGQVRVHIRNSDRSNLRLKLAQVFGSKQELPVEIVFLDCIEISDMNNAIWIRSAPILQPIAPGCDSKFALGTLDQTLLLDRHNGSLRVD